MRFFGKSVRTPNMGSRVPILGIVGLAAFVLAILAATGQVVPLNRSEGGIDSPQNAHSRGPIAPTVSGQSLLENAIHTLEGHRSISAKIRHSVDLFGNKPVGSGIYLEERSNRGLLFRLELRIQLGNELSSLLDVCDGRYLWMYRKLWERETLSRIHVGRVEQALEESGGIHEIGKVDRWPGLGGLPKLLRGLYRKYDFASVQETSLEGREGPLPVWRLEGEWKEAELAKLLPEQGEAVKGGKPADVSKLRPHLPDHVVLFLGKTDAFPYRIEYRRRRPNGRDGGEASRDKALVTMELSEVDLNAAIHSTRFLYNPGDLEYSDETAEFLKKLGLVR